MASLASLLNLGIVNTISVDHFEGSLCSVRRVYFSRISISSRKFWCGNRSRYAGVSNSSSLDSTYRSSSSGVRKDNGTGTVLRSPPNSMWKSGSKVDPLLNLPWDDTDLKWNSDNRNASDDKVMESLGEVLKKVEKLETSQRVNASTNKTSPGDQNNPNRKSKTMKNVWRKGNPVSTVQKIVKKPLKQEPSVRPPQKVQPELQSRPSLTPPPSIKKPTVSNSETGLTEEKKAHKPILIDKFASKKPAFDPSISQAVLAPSKPRKGSDSKFRDEFRNKGEPGDPRRRVVKDDIVVEDTSEFGVTIPGKFIARKGKKWSKASRKAARLQEALDLAPVRVEIMEVGEDGMLIEELSHNLAVSEGDILGYLHYKGMKPYGVQKLSKDVVKMICKEYEVEVIDGASLKLEDMAKKKEVLEEDDLDKLEGRPPVLTIMGHVDHGKTTLLDYIRKSKVAAGEAGGITQGIGAYKVQVPIDGMKKTCVFIDTPGHEAFGAMRARGARVTDIAIIVVAADDGVKPQTREAIAYAKAAGVPIVVAINKIDTDGANPNRVIQDLSSIGLMPDEWGGDVPMVQISALRGTNVDDLLEIVMLVAELRELKANPHRNAKGTVIEAGLDKSKGRIATFILQNGTLRKGDILVCGEACGKVRAMFDDNGERVDEAGPSIPVQVIGLNKVPLAGDEFEVVSSLVIAREKAESQAEYLRNKRLTEKAGDGKITLSSFERMIREKAGDGKDTFSHDFSGNAHGLDLHQLNIILKVDVQGSIEAIKQALQVLPQDNIALKYMLQATGNVTTSDIDLALATKATILGFNVKSPGSFKNVEIRVYKVIYELIDYVREAMEGLLEPVEEQVPIGMAEVRDVFRSGSGRVGGCMVTDGKVEKDCGIRVLRKGKEVYVGVLSSLRRVKEMVKEVNAGLECGIGVDDFNDWEAGDTVEAFYSVQKKRTLEEASASVSAALEKRGFQL